jgi:rhodanese-related sulfurtransferase
LERTIKPADLNPDTTLVLDVRREADYAVSSETIPGASWKNPDQISSWIDAVPTAHDVVIYCVRGGSVSNAGIKARFIEGGIEGWKAAGRPVSSKRPL